MKKIARISTDSIELALEQLIRTRTAGTKASIKPVFVIETLKELLYWRAKDRSLCSEVDRLFGDDLILVESVYDRPLRVIEVESLSELGASSCPSSLDLNKVEWKTPEEQEAAQATEEPEDLDDSDVTHEVLQRPVLRTNRRSGAMRARSLWQDGYTTRHVVIFALIAVIALTFIQLFLVF